MGAMYTLVLVVLDSVFTKVIKAKVNSPDKLWKKKCQPENFAFTPV